MKINYIFAVTSWFYSSIIIILHLSKNNWSIYPLPFLTGLAYLFLVLHSEHISIEYLLALIEFLYLIQYLRSTTFCSCTHLLGTHHFGILAIWAPLRTRTVTIAINSIVNLSNNIIVESFLCAIQIQCFADLKGYFN